ncbi:BC_2427 family protein [Bacillus cereus]|uniref:BC_2427 family protein n=1 Tax=Bacillus cereus TaxID=1396 RepID=UPI003D015A7D
MDKPWVGKGIWNKVYKGKMLNAQDDSREIREKKKSKETESKKEDKAIELEKESEKTRSAKEDKAKGLEEDEVKIEPAKEDEETESEKEEIVIESKKESEEIGSAKEDEETESEKEEIVIESKKESEETGSAKEDEETESEKEEIVIESKKESKETEPAKEEVTNESKKESIDSGSKIETSVRSIIVKTPFSIISDVTSFIKFPNINVKKQEAFVFRNEKDARGRELDAKLLTTVQHYHGEVNCNLVSSNLHEKRVLLEFSNQKVKGNMEENWIGTSSWIPIHGIILEKEDEADVNNYITGKLPIEIGRYKGEISLQEKVVFKEKVIGIKEVSQEIILTKKEFLLPKIIKKGHNPSIIEKGSLFVEGYIFQCIEFISEQSTSHDKLYQLMQNIVLELTIQLLQEQEVRVRIT